MGVTISVSRQTARIAGGLTVTSSGGAFTVKSTGNTDATAKGDGTTVETATDTETSVGAGVAVNLAFVTNEAIVGGGATIRGTSITVEATATAVGTDTTQVFGAEATSGAGDGKNSVAGSIAVNVVLSRTEARVASGVHSTVVAGGTGDVRVVAAATGTSTTKALSATGATAEDFGLGLSIAVAVVIEDTLALIDDGTTITGGARPDHRRHRRTPRRHRGAQRRCGNERDGNHPRRRRRLRQPHHPCPAWHSRQRTDDSDHRQHERQC